MSGALLDATPRMPYVDRHELLRAMLSEDDFVARRQVPLNRSTTIYVGNLSFYTTETQVMTHFASVGTIRDLVMGLNELTRTPCGFCFVVYESPRAASAAVSLLHGSILDDRVVSVGWDVGCNWSRRWGRGAQGGQVVDGVRQNLDEGRGGLGALRRGELGVGANVATDALVAYLWVPPKPARKGTERTGGGGAPSDQWRENKPGVKRSRN